jgi:hypothetical protein
MGVSGDPVKFAQLMSEVNETICPGALTLNLSRIDTKGAHRYHSLYEADRTYFRTSRHRAFIREARTGEWDYTPSNSVSVETYPTLELQRVMPPNEALKDVWQYIPRLWVLCVQLSEGTHHLSAVYRGDAMWKVVEREGSDVASFDSDAELSDTLAKIQACEGFDKAAWERFCQKYWDAAVMHSAAVTTKNPTIH